MWLYNDSTCSAHCHLFVDGRRYSKIIRIPASSHVAVPLDTPQLQKAINFRARFVLATTYLTPDRDGIMDVVDTLSPNWYKDCLAREHGRPPATSVTSAPPVEHASDTSASLADNARDDIAEVARDVTDPRHVRKHHEQPRSSVFLRLTVAP
jgi:hypothetical protein